MYTVQYITTHLPSDAKWAAAGRSQLKLKDMVTECKNLNAGHVQPGIEICNLTDSHLAVLAKKTFILACAETWDAPPRRDGRGPLRGQDTQEVRARR